MGKLILVRHGETEKNVSGLLHASSDPETLTAQGIKQIEATADFLKKYSPDGVYSSQETRAKQSGEIISKSLGLKLQVVEGFQERNWGVLSGKPWADLKNILDPLPLEERYVYVPPEGESWKTFETRLVAAIKKNVDKNEGKTIVVVTHGGAIRALMPSLLKVSKEESSKYDLDNASVTIFDFDKIGFHQVVVNDTCHLGASRQKQPTE